MEGACEPVAYIDEKEEGKLIRKSIFGTQNKKS